MTLFFKLLVATGTIGTAVAVPTVISLTGNKNLDTSLRVEQEVSEGPLSSSDSSAPSAVPVAVELAPIKRESLSPKTEVEKLKERDENANLCNEVARSSDGSFLRVCKEREDSTNVEFEYFVSRFNMPSPIKHLKFLFGSREIVITLEEKDSYGHKWVNMDLSGNILSGSGLFSSFAGGKNFTSKQCKLEGVYVNKEDWRINCQ